VKVGDLVKHKGFGKVGLVVDRFRRSIPDGNPNGDFIIYYVHCVLFNTGTMMIRNAGSVEVISEAG
jgi:hypothetical protein